MVSDFLNASRLQVLGIRKWLSVAVRYSARPVTEQVYDLHVLYVVRLFP